MPELIDIKTQIELIKSLQIEIELIKFIFPKIIVATICGLIIGWERERKHKVAGLRTIVLICVGSTIFTVASSILPKFYGVPSDPGRMMSTIVTGIGFLGGGVIIKTDDKVIGVTTAAFIWVIAAIGILCGIGAVLMPILVTTGLLLTSLLFQRLETFLRGVDKPSTIDN